MVFGPILLANPFTVRGYGATGQVGIRDTSPDILTGIAPVARS